MDILIITVQVVIIISLFIFWNWLKGLPQAIHKRQEQLFQQKLSKELELMKISQSQIQLRKIEKFIDFARLQTDILSNDEFNKKIANNNPKAVARLKELVIELGIGLFFFASDNTIRKYSKWKIETANANADPYYILHNLGSLMISLRKDVGYDDTELEPKDYLKMFITDWDKTEKKIDDLNIHN